MDPKIPSIEDDEVFELTNIKVREVSLVDRAANRRKFIVTKRDKKGTADPITAEDAAKALEKAQELQANSPAAELDRKDAEAAELEKAKWSVAFQNDLPDSSFLYIEAGGEKDDEGKTKPRSLRHFPVKDANGEIDLPHLRNALARIPQSSLPQDVKDRLSAKAEKMLAGTKKSEEVTEAVVEESPVVETAPAVVATTETVDTSKQGEIAAPSSAQAQLQNSWLGAIQAIQGRLNMMAEDAKAAYGYPAGHIEYIKCMLDCMYDIGTPAWDIAVAATAATASAKAYSKKKAEEKAKAETPGVVEPVAAVVQPAFDITQAPAFKAMQDSIKKQEEIVTKLTATIASQEKELSKARSTVRSNALTHEADTQHNDVKWDRDMASPSKRYGR